MVALTRLTPGNVALLEQIEPSPIPDPWEQEVELAALGPIAARMVLDNASTVLVASDDGGNVVGAIGYGPDARWKGSALYISFVLVDHRFRGNGLGRALLRHALEHVHTAGAHYAVWMVHQQNATMLKLSREVAGDEFLGDVGYAVFMHP